MRQHKVEIPREPFQLQPRPEDNPIYHWNPGDILQLSACDEAGVRHRACAVIALDPGQTYVEGIEVLEYMGKQDGMSEGSWLSFYGKSVCSINGEPVRHYRSAKLALVYVRDFLVGPA